MNISFEKYEGAGNDFIMINNLDGNIKLEPSEIVHICDRHFGIGADGIILVEKSKKPEADCFMNYYNSDGTEAEMCGNGIRCTAKFFLSQIVGNRTSNNSEILIDTRAGIKKIIKNNDDTYSVNMGMPIFESNDFPTCLTCGKIQGYDLNFVSMGNPHAVTFVKDVNDIDVKLIGSKIENDFHFPNKTNVEFVQKIDENNYKVRVWERGCGETLACGTGACAVYAILNKLSPRHGLGELLENEIILEFLGGKLYLSKNRDGAIILRGPAEFVFKGEIEN